MKIKRIVKLKREMYDVLFDDGQSIKVHEESLVRYVLIPGKELDEEEFNEIVQNIQYDQAYVTAIKYISYKIRSIKEMGDYLSEDYEMEIVSQTIYRLQDEGYLNDENYARSLRNTLLNTTDKGPGHLQRELKKHQIPENTIYEETQAFDELVDSERMNKLKDKFLRTHRGSYSQFKQKLREKLTLRGYRSHHFELIDFDDDFDEGSYFEKDFEKYYNRYQKKESGFKLKQKMIAAMMSKGYAYDKISEKLGGMNDG